MSRIDIGNNIRKPATVPATAEAFLELSGDKLTGSVCAELADLLEQQQRGELGKSDYQALKAELKRRLHFYTPHAHFLMGYKSSEGEPEDSGKVVADFDGYAAGAQVYENYIKGRERELGINMFNISVSGNGFAILADIPEGLTRQQAQQWLSDLVGGIPYDKAVHELERGIYIPCRDYILYMDEELMFGDELHPAKLTDEELKKYQQAPAAPCNKTPQADHTQNPQEPSARALAIFEDTLQMVGLDLPTLNREGVRHNTLKLLLPTLCQMMTPSELLGVLAEKMPDYSREQDCRTLVTDFYAKYVDPSRPMTLKQKELFLKSLKVADDTTADDTATNGDKPKQQPIIVDPRQLPIGLKESVKGNPDFLVMPILVGIMPLTMALASDVTVRYIDNRIHHLGSMAIIKTEQANHKAVIEYVVDAWLRNIRKEDEVVRQREDDVKRANKLRKQSERGQAEPMEMVREVTITISCSKLLRRLKAAQGKTLYSFCPEMDTLLKSNGAGSWSAKYDVYRCSFDRSLWGQDYNGEQSESGRVPVAYNWTILSTPGQLRKCFGGDNVENGLSGRVMLSEIPFDPFAPLTVYHNLTEQEQLRIDQAVEKLRSASGFYDTPRLRKAIEQWVENVRKRAAKSGDLVTANYRKRAAVLGFRCGVVFMLLAGKESKACVDFALKMAEYTLQMQCSAFGKMYLKQRAKDRDDDDTKNTTNGVVYDDLPQPFTMADLRARKGAELTDAALYTIIHRWSKEGWIRKEGKKFFKQLNKEEEDG